jgi:hypothetical protein
MNGAPLTVDQVSKAARLIRSSQPIPDCELVTLLGMPKRMRRNARGLPIDAQQMLVLLWALTKWTGATHFTEDDLEAMRAVIATAPHALLQPFSADLVASLGVH